MNICEQDVPAYAATFRVSHGQSPNLEPAVLAIGTSATVLTVVGMPGFDRTSKGGDHARKVIRMNDVAGGPTLQFLRRLAEIFQDLVVEELKFPCRTHGAYEPGNAIDDHAQIVFALAESFLGALPVFNISGNTIPANHAATVIPQGLSIGTKPAIDVIEPAHTLVYITRLTSLDGMQPCRSRSLDILGMEYVSPSKPHQVLQAFAGVVQNSLI